MPNPESVDYKGTQTDKAQPQGDAAAAQAAQSEVNQTRATGNSTTVDNSANSANLVNKGMLPPLSIDMGSDSGSSSSMAGSDSASHGDPYPGFTGLAPGSQQSTNKDGVTITTDSNGLLSQTTTADGASRTFQRDDHGNLQTIVNPDGSSWQKGDGGWSQYDSNGQKIGNPSPYAPQTYADGSFTVTSQDGSVSNFKSDGTGQSKQQDGSIVDLNDKGQISKVTYQGGSSRSFTYDGTGGLSSFTDSNGKTYNNSDGSFKAADGSSISGNPRVTADGKLQIDQADGSRTVYDTTGAVVSQDSSGNVNQVRYANGAVREFGRDGSGQINSITETDGNSWKKQADSTWQEYDKNGNATGNTNTAQPSVDGDGNYTLKNSDGSSETRRIDGSTIKSDKDNRVSEIDYASGKSRHFTYDSAGKVTSEKDENGSISRLQSDGSWKGGDGSQPLLVAADGTITSWKDGVYSKTSSVDQTATPRNGDNLYGTNSDDPLKSITPDAVHQGDLGDCYFLAGVAAVAASNPQAIKDMIHDNGNGTYTVTFPGDASHPQTVSAPTADELERYAHDDGSNGTWVSVLEKAHRQLTGNETSDSGGATATGLQLLSPKGTSVPTGVFDAWEEIGLGNFSFNHESLSDTDKILTDAMQNHKAVVAGTGSDNWVIQHIGESNNPDNLVSQHEYAVVGYDSATQKVTLRNPWGGDGEDGTFSLTLQQFHDHFSDIAYQD